MGLFKKIVVFKLRIATRILLLRLRPEVIAVTGSAGKTTTKEFIKKVLEADFEVLAPAEGYNTEIGSQLALFGESAPVKTFSVFAWLVILLKIYFKALFKKNLAEKIVVEMGADTPGDIKYLANVFKPKKAVILTVLPVHLENFVTIEAVANEKAELARALPKDGALFLNADDKLVAQMARETKANVFYFGTKSADFLAKNLKNDITGTSFILNYKEKNIPIMARVYGKHMVYPLLAAIAVGAKENISASRISSAVKELRPFKGRMNVIEGIRGSLIIDDSYNANPKSMLEALDFLKTVTGRKIAVLGNMNELGSYEREGHELVGKQAAKVANILVTVGEVAEKYLAAEASKNGLKNIKTFKDSDEAGDYLKSIIREGDVVLLKGSQNMVRLERAAKKILAKPEDAEKILVRQSKFWKER